MQIKEPCRVDRYGSSRYQYILPADIFADTDTDYFNSWRFGGIVDDIFIKTKYQSRKSTAHTANEKSLWPPEGQKNCHKMWVYCIQNDRLGHMIPTKQTVN